MVAPIEQALQYRLARHYLTRLRAANDAYKRGSEGIVYALNVFDRDWQQIKHWQSWVDQHSVQDHEALSLCSAYAEVGADLLSLRQEPRERLVWLETALRASRELGDQHAEIQHLIATGDVYESLSTYELAASHLRLALELAHQIKDQSNLPIILYRLAEATWGQADYATAQNLCEECLALSRALGDALMIARALGGLGIVALYQGDLATATSYFSQALKRFRAAGDQAGIARYLHNLGGCNMEMGNFRQARDYFEQSLVIHQAIGHKLGIANCLNTLGLNAVNQGLLADAQDFLQQAYETFETIGHRRGVADSLSNLGLVALQKGDHHLAQDDFVQSLDIRREIGDQRGMAASLGNLGLVAMTRQEYQTASDYLEQTVALNRDRGDRFNLTLALCKLAYVCIKLEHVLQARQILRESLELACEIDSLGLELTALVMCAWLWLKTGNAKQAAAYASLVFHHPAAVQDDHDTIEELRPELETTLSPEEFTDCWEHGKTLELDAVIPTLFNTLSS
jgi:tetratricopeptide (TPR) repeat protein